MANKRSQQIQPGSTLAGRYEIIRVLGEGGMGCVFLAQHKQVKRNYALKLLWLTANDNQRTYQRFLQEARVAGSFDHANLASVYDYGETEDGHPFIVMDFVDGVSLHSILEQEEQIDLIRAIKIFLQICAGLTHIHGKGLVHRDLKPANIMVVQSNHGNGDSSNKEKGSRQDSDHAEEQIKIVDFGITKILAKSSESDEDSTKAGEVFGSPCYSGPEQCLGYPVDARSDIYALGCLMYHTLTGKRPFEGETAIETIVMQLHQSPLPFSAICPDRRMPHLLEQIIFKCLEKRPEDRYSSASAVAEELTAVLRRLTGSQQKPGSLQANIDTVKLNPVGSSKKKAGAFHLVTILAAILALVALAFFLSVKYRTVKHPQVTQPAATRDSRAAASESASQSVTDTAPTIPKRPTEAQHLQPPSSPATKTEPAN